jgi:hypothetical protein
LYCQVYRGGSQTTHASFGGIVKTVDIKEYVKTGNIKSLKTTNENLYGIVWHTVMIFLSSVRFMGYFGKRKECEDFFMSKQNWLWEDDE